MDSLFFRLPAEIKAALAGPVQVCLELSLLMRRPIA